MNRFFKSKGFDQSSIQRCPQNIINQLDLRSKSNTQNINIISCKPNFQKLEFPFDKVTEGKELKLK